ncbi:unnamed protein product [Arabidopsis thaliana]|uniref:Uncharacterized protein n=1 Tax=Arabidopsis thaliana TaxID=3702 RepID=A0A654FGU3_ARATH|nr:unnamed protein product [Arabidopsis thaliana]
MASDVHLSRPTRIFFPDIIPFAPLDPDFPHWRNQTPMVFYMCLESRINPSVTAFSFTGDAWATAKPINI